MADTLTLYKLIVLKMLDEADAPLTGAQITDFILEKSIPIISHFSRYSQKCQRQALSLLHPPETAPSIGSQIPADIP